MKTFILILSLFTIASALPLFTLNTRLSDIPACVTDLRSDFSNLEVAIETKNWSAVADLIKNISKTYADCKDAYGQVQTCVHDGKAVVSNLVDIIGAVKSKDMNPFHYINFLKSMYTNVKTFSHDCYVTKQPAKVDTIPQDLAKCGSDLKAEFQAIYDAFHNKDMSRIEDLIKGMATTFVDCQAAYKHVSACATPAVGAVESIVNLIKYAEVKDVNPMDYINAVRALVVDVEGVVHNCFD